VLNYNVPHATEYEAVGFVEIPPHIPTAIPGKSKPINNYWDLNKNRPIEDLLLDLAKNPNLIHNYTKYTGGYELDSSKRSQDEIFNYEPIENPPPSGPTGPTLQEVTKGKSSDIKANFRHIAENINQGFMPVVIN